MNCAFFIRVNLTQVDVLVTHPLKLINDGVNTFFSHSVANFITFSNFVLVNILFGFSSFSVFIKM